LSQPLTKIPSTFAETRIDDEIVVMDLSSGDFFSLTGSAAAIWDLLDGTRDRAAVLAALASDFDASAEDMASDLDTFLGELRASGLIDGE
jgi:pyrroloquinoline quinone biosynthesis protein D